MTEHDQIKKNVETVFDSVSKKYDENRFFLISADKLIELACFKGDERVLDLSTGTGNISISIAKRYPNTQIEAIDLSNEMMSMAKIKCEEKGICSINFTKMDAEKLEFEKNSFDIITCGYALFFYPNLDSTLKSIISLLKPGGKFIFSTFTDEAFMPYSKNCFELLNTFDSSIEPPSGKLLNSKEEIELLLKECGLNDFKIEQNEIRYKITPDEWWKLINSGGFKGYVDKLSEAHRKAFKQKHLENIERLSENGQIDLVTDSFYTIVSR